MSRKHKGFTLIEVLVSLLILGVGLIFLVQMMGQAARLSQRSRNLTLAGFLAHEKMEEIFRDGYGVFGEDKNYGEGKGVYSRFRWQQQIIALSSEEPGLKEVRVTVSCIGQM